MRFGGSYVVTHNGISRLTIPPHSGNGMKFLEIPSRHLRISGQHHGHRVPDVIIRKFARF
jgi:hypothetical protein